ncbi:MAG: amino acid ABC transporter substrate-binding protein [Bacteroidota bacterium]|nr:amino acid ABC transporter substrate-binding protein [Kiloniellaceae bacterium]
MKCRLAGSLATLLLTAALLSAGLPFSAEADAATLERVRDSGAIKIGYREDAKPFSYADASGLPTGYTVEICNAVVSAVRQRLQRDDIKAQYVLVTAENRFAKLKSGEIDLLCGASSITLERRAEVDFSLLTFVTGSSVLYRKDGPANFLDLVGQKVGVRAGTTTEEGLQGALAEAGIEAQVVAVESHEAGLRDLENGTLAAYFADRAILAMLGRSAQQPENLRLSDRFFSYEPYALALPRGDSDFRLLVDTTLARLYRSQGIVKIYHAHFGDAPVSDLLRATFTLQALPE